MVSFNDQHKVLQAWKAKVMKRVINGEIELTDSLIHGFRLNYNELVEITMRVPLLKLSSVETLSGLSNKYVKDYQAIVRFIDDNIPSLNGFG